MRAKDGANTIQVSLTPLLVDAATVGKVLGVSRRTVYNMHAEGTLGPQPIALGSRKLWRTDELSRWVLAGCPRREAWVEIEDNG